MFPPQKAQHMSFGHSFSGYGGKNYECTSFFTVVFDCILASSHIFVWVS